MLHPLQELEKTTRTGCWQFEPETNKLYRSHETYRIQTAHAHALILKYRPKNLHKKPDDPCP